MRGAVRVEARIRDEKSAPFVHLPFFFTPFSRARTRSRAGNPARDRPNAVSERGIPSIDLEFKSLYFLILKNWKKIKPRSKLILAGQTRLKLIGGKRT